MQYSLMSLHPPVTFHAHLPDYTLHKLSNLAKTEAKSGGRSCSPHCAFDSHAKTKTAFKAKARAYPVLLPPTRSHPENHIGRKPTEPQTPTAMDPEDVATNTLITISTVGKRTPPNTPLLGKSLDKSRSDAGEAGARSTLAGIQASAPNPPFQPRG